jgi:hypothetical protein
MGTVMSKKDLMLYHETGEVPEPIANEWQRKFDQIVADMENGNSDAAGNAIALAQGLIGHYREKVRRLTIKDEE